MLHNVYGNAAIGQVARRVWYFTLLYERVLAHDPTAEPAENCASCHPPKTRGGIRAACWQRRNALDFTWKREQAD